MSNRNTRIRDNHDRGTVGDFLKSNIENGSSLSVVSAYFTIHAFEALKGICGKLTDFGFCSVSLTLSTTLTQGTPIRKPSKLRTRVCSLTSRFNRDQLPKNALTG